MTRREWWQAAAVMAAGSACGRKAGAGYPGYALIATAGEDSVAIADLSEFRLVRQVRVDASPSAILAGGASHASYVLTPETGSIHLLDHNLNRVAWRKLADDLCGLRLTPDGKRLFAIAGRNKMLIEADARTLLPIERWKLPAEPVALDLAAGGIAVSTGEHGVVDFIHLESGRRSRKEFAGAAGELRFRPDGKLLLVSNRREQSVTALDVPSLRVVVDLPLAMQPQNLCFNSDGGQLFVSGPGMDGVAIVFPYLPLEVEQTVLAGRDPGVMACSADPAYLFVASASGSDVCILNIENRKVIGIVEVGQKPSYITVTPDSQYALVLNENSADMAVIRTTSIRAKMGNAAKMRSKSGASLFTMLPVGSRPVHAAIVPKLG